MCRVPDTEAHHKERTEALFRGPKREQLLHGLAMASGVILCFQAQEPSFAIPGMRDGSKDRLT